jgi:hypothetical protein
MATLTRTKWLIAIEASNWPTISNTTRFRRHEIHETAAPGGPALPKKCRTVTKIVLGAKAALYCSNAIHGINRANQDTGFVTLKISWTRLKHHYVRQHGEANHVLEL